MDVVIDFLRSVWTLYRLARWRRGKYLAPLDHPSVTTGHVDRLERSFPNNIDCVLEHEFMRCWNMDVADVAIEGGGYDIDHGRDHANQWEGYGLVLKRLLARAQAANMRWEGDLPATFNIERCGIRETNNKLFLFDRSFP